MNYCLALIIASELCTTSSQLQALQHVQVKSPDVQIHAPFEETVQLFKDPSKWVVTCTRNQKIAIGTIAGVVFIGLLAYYRKNIMAKGLNFWDWLRNAQLTQLEKDQELYKAIAANKLTGFRGAEMWWMRGAHVNSTAQDGMPIHIASHNGNEEAVRWLMLRGALVNALDIKRETPAMKTVANPREHTKDILYLLRQYNADFTIQDNSGKTVLAHAVSHQTQDTDDVLKIILNQSPGIGVGIINVQDSAGESALMKAIHSPDDNFRALGLTPQTTRSLIQAGANIHLKSQDGHDALWRAVRYGYEEIVRALLNRSDSWNQHFPDLEEALRCAVQYEKLHLIEPLYQEIVARKGTLSAESTQAIQNYYEALMLQEAIKIADKKISLRMVQQLLLRPHLTAEARTEALRTAVIESRVDLIPHIMKAGVTLNFQDAQGQTILMQAIKLDQTDAALAILNWALKDNGSIVHGVGLHIAPAHDDVLRVIFRSIIDFINMQDSQDNTALHLAAENNNATMVNKLLELGADKTLLNHAGQTPEQVARSNGYTALADILRTPGGLQNIFSYRCSY